jgi:hypothetical protein
MMKMKNLIKVFMIIGMFSSGIMHAQDTAGLKRYYPKPFISRFEFLIGPAFSTIRDVDMAIGSTGSGLGTYLRTSPIDQFGISVGVGLSHSFSKHFEITTRFMYERKGIQQHTDSLTLSPYGLVILNNGAYADVNTKLDYFNFYILPQWMPGEQRRVNIGAGGYFGLLSSSQVSTQYYSTYQGHLSITKLDAADYDYGISINVGYSHPVGKIRWTIQSVYSYGLNQVSNLHKVYSAYPAWYNSSLSLTLGVQLINTKNKLRLM